MNPWGNVVRVYDRYGTPHVRTLGTSDPEQIPELKAFVRWLRTKRKWDALDLIIARKLSISDAYDAHEAGQLAELVRERKLAAEDVDLSPLVTEWAERANAKYVKQVRTLITDDKPFPASRFSRKEVSRFLAGLPVADPTRNRYRAALSVFARWLVEREVLDFNPVRDVRGFKEHDPRDKWLTTGQAQAVVNASPHAYRTLFALCYGAGVEIGAALKLTFSDVEYGAQAIHIRGSKTRWRNRFVRVEPWAWAHMWAKGLLGGPLFPGITYDMAYDAHKAALKALGLSGYTLHDARHSFAVNALRRGVRPEVVAYQLGHRDASMVHRVYGRYIPKGEDYEPKTAKKPLARRRKA
jgi:integrase